MFEQIGLERGTKKSQLCVGAEPGGEIVEESIVPATSRVQKAFRFATEPGAEAINRVERESEVC